MMRVNALDIMAIILLWPASHDPPYASLRVYETRSLSYGGQVMRSNWQRGPLAAASLPSPVTNGPSSRSADVGSIIDSDVVEVPRCAATAEAAASAESGNLPDAAARLAPRRVIRRYGEPCCAMPRRPRHPCGLGRTGHRRWPGVPCGRVIVSDGCPRQPHPQSVRRGRSTLSTTLPVTTPVSASASVTTPQTSSPGANGSSVFSSGSRVVSWLGGSVLVVAAWSPSHLEGMNHCCSCRSPGKTAPPGPAWLRAGIVQAWASERPR